MKLWNRIKSAIGLAVEITPILPVPVKVKKLVKKIGDAEAAVTRHQSKKRPVKPS